MWFKTIFRRSGKPARQQRVAEQFAIDETLIRRLDRLSVEARRTLRGTPASGAHPSREQMPATITSDHRPYTPGDDYRYVDWNAYARQEQVVVRLGEAEQSVNIHVLLDVSRSMAQGTDKFASTQLLAAALGYISLANGDRVRLTPFGTSAQKGFGPAQGKLRAMDMLRFVETLATTEQTDFAALAAYARAHERGGILVLCSDLFGGDAAALEQALRAFPPPRWQVLVLHMLSRAELAPTVSGTLELQDAETGQVLPLTIDDDALATYRRNLADWQEAVRQACARRGATYAMIPTDWPFERAVLPFLRVRSLIR